jgi:DNA-binding transcriptional regulator YiaG
VSALLDEVHTRRQLPSRALARAIREEACVSQARLAAALGVHPVTVARWELGLRHPRGQTLAAYVRLLAELRESR